MSAMTRQNVTHAPKPMYLTLRSYYTDTLMAIRASLLVNPETTKRCTWEQRRLREIEKELRYRGIKPTNTRP